MGRRLCQTPAMLEYSTLTSSCSAQHSLLLVPPSTHFFLFRPATPPANRPRLLKLDLALWPCAALPAAGVTGGRMAPAGELGRSPAFFGGTGGPFDTFSSTVSRPTGTSSPMAACWCVRLAFSCVALNRSRSSVHLTLPSSLALSRLGRSKPDADGPCGALEVPTSELFCLKWFRVLDWGTYVRGAMCRYPMADTLFSLFFRAANADDWGRSMRSPYRHLYR
jgi:hypothetical protein